MEPLRHQRLDESLGERQFERQVSQPLLEPEAEAAKPPDRQCFWTIVGVVALLLWSTSFAGARIVGDAAGDITATGICFLVGGLGSCGIYAALGKFKKSINHPMSYYIQCGVPFVLYPVCLYLGFHFAVKDSEINVLTAINNLWPHIMSALLVLVFKKSWKWTLIPGILGAVCMVLVTTVKPGEEHPLRDMFYAMVGIWPAAVCSLFAAFTWAIFSVLSCRYAQQCRAKLERGEVSPGDDDGTLGALPLLTAITGIVMLLCDLFITENRPGPFDDKFMSAMAYLTVVPFCGCRFAWDFALAGGDMMVLNTTSYLKPFLATFWNIVLLGIPLDPFSLIGSAGLAFCAIIVKVSIES